MISQQICTVVYKCEQILSNTDTSTLIRVRLYELISTIIKLDFQMVNEAFAEEATLMACVVNDFDRYQSNSVMLTILMQLVEEVTEQ